MRTTGLTILFLLLSAGETFLSDGSATTSFPLLNKKVVFNFPVISALNSQKNSSVIDTTELKNSSWYSQVIKNIEESEYEIKYDDQTLSYASPNRKQNLKAFYTGEKFTLLPRNDSADRWKLNLQLKGIYAGKKKLYSVSNDPVVTQNGNTIQFNHNSQFITEYINSKEGVRQNFIISQKPAGNPKNLRVELDANKDWFINKVADKEIHFAKATQNGYDKKITYNGLKAWDSNGKELEVAFVVNENTIFIEVNTSNVAYPITIDPLSTTANTVLEGNKANAHMGSSVASAGDVNGDGYSDVIVGAYLYDNGQAGEGAAFIFHGSATGITNTIQAHLEINQGSAYLGSSVASAGDVNADGYSDVIVGAYLYDGGSTDEGAVFIFHGSATGITTTIQAQLEVNQISAQMGWSVASAGDVNGDGFSDVIVGANVYDNNESQEGAAFIYHGSPGGITTTIQTQLEGNQASVFMGWSVASAGDVNGDGYSDVIVGVIGFENGNSGEGAAFVYLGSASGIINTIQAQLEANSGLARMGNSVASAGDVNGDGYSDVIIGAELFTNGESFEGAAFVYHGSASGITTTRQAQLESNQVSSYMGCSVASAGDVNGDGYGDVIVGARWFDNVQFTEGAAFFYYGSSSGIMAIIQAQLEINQTGAEMGWSVASAGDVNGDGYSDIIVGALAFDNGEGEEGAAFVYHGGPVGVNMSFSWAAEGNQMFASMGISVASAGDVNGDGYSDVIVGAYAFDNGQTDEGVAFVFLGTVGGLSTSAQAILECNQAGANLGYSVSCAGDVNGDGYSDVIVGARLFSNIQLNEGAAFVFHGSASGIIATIQTQLENDQSDADMGSSVSAGDFNGDGYSDVIVGAFRYDNTEINEGAAFMYHGGPAGISPILQTQLESNQPNAQMGFRLASAGDVNGDGFSDVIVGANMYDNPEINEGAAFIFHGSPSGISSVIQTQLEYNQAGAQMGRVVAPAGDVNGDGYGDVIVGAQLYSNGEAGEGAAFVFHGSATGVTTTVQTLLEVNQANARFGVNVSSAGDVNGDGYSDVIVGADIYDNGQTDEGAAFVFHGSPSGITTNIQTQLEVNQANAIFGNSLACAGDVNGDGYSDVIIGAQFYNNGQSAEGAAFTFYGNNTGGLRNNLRLYNQDLVTPIQQSSIAPALFGAGLYSKSPLGRQKGKLVWETVKNGQSFPGNPITNSTTFLSQQSAYTDLGLTGFELTNQIAKQFNSRVTYIRARVKYDPVTAITGQVYGPWRYPESFLRGNRDIGAVVLPVKFISFVALKQSDDVLLRWITTDETAGIEYEVQYSTDGINFQTIKNITGIGNSRNEYEWLHSNPSTGKNFYRIRAVDNGKDAFTVIRQINFDKISRLLIYPNPAKSGSQLTIGLTNNPATGALYIELFSINGQKKAGYSIASAGNNINITLPELPAGGYILKLIKEKKEIHSGSFVIVQ